MVVGCPRGNTTGKEFGAEARETGHVRDVLMLRRVRHYLS
jgi:hypothetical protein